MAEDRQGGGPAGGDLIPLEVAARLLMIGAERIRQLSKAGYIPIPKRGHTTIVGAVQGYIRFLKEDARKETKTAAASRATDARAREIEQRIAMRERDLIPQEDAQLVVDRLAGLFAAAMAGLPARLTRDVALRRQYEATCHDVQTEVAEAVARGAVALRTGGGDLAADGGDDA